jgi:hypothetical protein
VVANLKSSTTTTADLTVTLNNNTGSVYGRKGIYTTTTTVVGTALTSAASAWTLAQNSAWLPSSAAAIGTTLIMDIFNYSSGTLNKTMTANYQLGVTTATGGTAEFGTLWGNSSITAAVTQVDVRSTSGTNLLNAATVIQLWGIK